MPLRVAGSCFAASSMQCLIASPGLLKYFVTEPHDSDRCRKQFCLVCTFQQNARASAAVPPARPSAPAAC